MNQLYPRCITWKAETVKKFLIRLSELPATARLRMKKGKNPSNCSACLMQKSYGNTSRVLQEVGEFSIKSSKYFPASYRCFKKRQRTLLLPLPPCCRKIAKHCPDPPSRSVPFHEEIPLCRYRPEQNFPVRCPAPLLDAAFPLCPLFHSMIQKKFCTGQLQHYIHRPDE